MIARRNSFVANAYKASWRLRRLALCGWSSLWRLLVAEKTIVAMRQELHTSHEGAQVARMAKLQIMRRVLRSARIAVFEGPGFM